MFESNHKTEDSSNTFTAFLLAVAFVMIPAAMMFLRPLGLLSLAVGMTASLVCVGIAWANRKHATPAAAPAVITIDKKRN
ncbi:MAG: hypothetical protein ABL995_10760 [Bryobacteraceae bacterium]